MVFPLPVLKGKWAFLKSYVTSVVLQDKKHLYEVVSWQKNFGAPTHPTLHFRGSKSGHYPKFSKFSSAKNFFRKVSWKKFFSRKDAYRVTWLGRKKLGDGVCTISDLGWKWLSDPLFDPFWPNPQMGFSEVIYWGCVGAPQNFGNPELVTHRRFVPNIMT